MDENRYKVNLGYDLNADVENTLGPVDLSQIYVSPGYEQEQQDGRIPKPPLPPGQDIDANIEEAKHMSYLEFLKSVKSGGKWDYKLQGPGLKPNPLEASGNMNFGATAKALGLSDQVIKMGAGAYQIYEGHSKPEWGGPSDLFKHDLPGWAAKTFPVASAGYLINKYKGVLLNPSHGDQPIDQHHIDQGIGYYNQHQRDQEKQGSEPQ